MIGKAVGLYHYSLPSPEGVDFPAPELDLELRPGKAAAAAEPEKEAAVSESFRDGVGSSKATGP